MKKIVIVSDQREKNKSLIKLIGAVFPECEICVVSPELGGVERYWGKVLPDPQMGDAAENENVKDFDHECPVTLRRALFQGTR